MYFSASSSKAFLRILVFWNNTFSAALFSNGTNSLSHSLPWCCIDFPPKEDKNGGRKSNIRLYKLLYSMLCLLKWRLCDKRCHMAAQFIILPQTCTANVCIAIPPPGLQWGSPPCAKCRTHIMNDRPYLKDLTSQRQEIPTNQRYLLSSNGWMVHFVSMTLVATDGLGGGGGGRRRTIFMML